MSADVRPLTEADFHLTCDNGFGDGWNQYAHSMQWFRGKLYVGTTRATMALLRINAPVPDIKPWPVECPDDFYDIDRRAEIWELTPETGEWRLVYKAPAVDIGGGRKAPRYMSYRGMASFQGERDAAPCLYVATWAPLVSGKPDLLRSEDGRNFEVVSTPSWDDSVRSFRCLQPFNGWLHTTPASAARGVAQVGKMRTMDSIGGDPTIYATRDPSSGEWHKVNLPGFGDAENLSIFEMEVFDDHLYAGTVNVNGFELWKTRGGTPPYEWTRVLSHGAERGTFNEVVISMCPFKGALYVGSGVLNGGYHRALNVGPAAAEVIRVWPDDRWDLITGDSRSTSTGLRFPLSGFSPGFDNLFAGYIWRMCEHEGFLYLGTMSWANHIPYLPKNLWPEELVAMLNKWGDENLVRRFGGFELWRSGDGVHWEPVTRSGFGNKFNWGVRNLASTEHGLFVATSNPFGPRVAVQRDHQWCYVDNPRGGCEVWLGSGREASVAEDAA